MFIHLAKNPTNAFDILCYYLKSLTSKLLKLYVFAFDNSQVKLN